MAEARVQAILAEVRATGGRVTVSRRALVTELVSAGGHLTADDLVERMRKSQPDLAESTVYRLLTDMEDRGLLRHVHMVHGPSVYHLGDEVHHHVRCSQCGEVLDIPAGLLEPVIGVLRDEFGFELDPGHSALQGTCASCRD